MDSQKIPARVAGAAQLASLLEVSGYPKPGNVHRARDFADVRYEHFLAGSVAMGESVKLAAIEGAKAGEGKLECSKIGIGEKVKLGVNSVKKSHRGGNTHLGTILLFIPLAAAAGKTYAEDEKMHVGPLRKNVDEIIKSTSTDDSLNVFDAIRSAIGSEKEKEGEGSDRSSWLGKAEHADLSLTEGRTRGQLSQKNISLYKWMEASSKWDGIARELTSKMEASFEVGFPSMMKVFRKNEDINVAVVHTFLTILSEYPDTFIARKVGLKKTPHIAEAVKIGMRKARDISARAKSVLEEGGLTTEKGREKINDFDLSLREADEKLNPGTTADLTAASIMIAILNGLKY